MRTLIKNIKELVQVECQPKLRAQGKEMAQMETIKEGYLMRTPRGREATSLAYQHLGKLKTNGNQQELF